MSIRQQIRDRAIEELNTDRPSDIPEASKRRYVPGSALNGPKLAVFFGKKEDSQPATNRHSPLRLRDLQLATQCIQTVERPEEIDDAPEPMLEWVVGVLGASNLNELAHEVEEVGTYWEVEYRDLIYVAASVLWRVRYQTLRDDLTAQQ
jgi:hypothetical protein